MSWIFTASPGEKVRVVESEKERGALLAAAGTAAAQASRSNAENRRRESLIDFLAGCSSGIRRESWGWRGRDAIAARGDRGVRRARRGATGRAGRDRGRYRKPLRRWGP